MLFVTHPVADVINHKLDIINWRDFRLIHDENKTWFIDYDLKWRGQELDEERLENTSNNRFSKHIKEGHINPMKYIL